MSVYVRSQRPKPETWVWHIARHREPGTAHPQVECGMSIVPSDVWCAEPVGGRLCSRCERKAAPK